VGGWVGGCRVCRSEWVAYALCAGRRGVRPHTWHSTVRADHMLLGIFNNCTVQEAFTVHAQKGSECTMGTHP
jgi:hypothetical protein